MDLLALIHELPLPSYFLVFVLKEAFINITTNYHSIYCQLIKMAFIAFILGLTFKYFNQLVVIIKILEQIIKITMGLGSNQIFSIYIPLLFIHFSFVCLFLTFVKVNI